MAAIFLALSNTDLFKSGSSASSLVSIPKLDALVNAQGLALYTDVSVQLGETIQYFLTFDDVTKYIHFGKGLSSITVNGMMFMDCNGSIPSLDKFFSKAISQLRGTPQKLVVGSTVFTVVMSNSALTVMAEPDTMAQFQITFSVIDHSL